MPGAGALILLDTTICIHIINAKPPPVIQRFKGYRMGEIGICFSGTSGDPAV